VIILFGFRTSHRRLAVLTMVCEVCGVTAAQALIKRSTRFTVFFVPLFPVRRGTYHLECSNCGAMRPVDPREATRLAA
jgi:translation initiation factor 2 beta subunit (eIF-2beta)/eIF-5